MKQFISDVKLSQHNSTVQQSNVLEKNNEALDLSSPPLRNEDSRQEENKNQGSDRDSTSSPAIGADSQIFEFEDDGMTMTSNYPVDSVNYDCRKKFRTQISHLQVKMMKSVFEVYKMPTMSECQILAEYVGLQKRVVQVWFQNARAKEKKGKLQTLEGEEEEPQEVPGDLCRFCHCQYGNKYKVQEHLFDRDHLENVRKAIEAGKYEPENPGVSLQEKSKPINLSNLTREPGSKLFNYQGNHLDRPSKPDTLDSSNHEKQNNHFVGDPSYSRPPQQHYRTDQQSFNLPPQLKYYEESQAYRQGAPYPQGSQEYSGYCQPQMGYPGAGPHYPPYPSSYGGGYSQGYSNVMAGYPPYQSGVPN